MSNFIEGLCGATACMLAGTFFDNLPAAVSVICTCAVTVVTCFVQLYRMWRDKDSDIKKAKKSSIKEKEQDENV